MGERDVRRPSYLAVDRWIAADEPAPLDGLDAELLAHRDEVRHVDVDEVPGWVLSLGPREPWWRRWTSAWLPGLVLAASLLLAALVVARPPGPYVGAKGAPSAVVHVVRAGGERAAVWDGTPLGAGDRIRLELGGLGDAPYAVVHVAPGEPPEVLVRGAGDGLVPGTWALDGAARGARLVVVPGGPGDAAALLAREPLLTVPLR